MKKTFFLLILSVLFLSCKKDNTDSKLNDNYVKIDNDTRSLGTISSGDIEYSSAAWSAPDQWQFVVDIENKCDNIKGLKNNKLRLYFDIWDKKLLKTEYNIDLPQVEGTASIRMDILGGNNLDLVFGSELGKKLYITKDDSGRLKSVRFFDLKMGDSRYIFTVSANLTIGN